MEVTGDVEVGVDLFQLSLRLAKNEFKRWVDWAPQPCVDARDHANQLGNSLLVGALGWILRHELAHHHLGHHQSRSAIPAANIAQEHEADAKATEWFKADFKADHDRPDQEKPSANEIELERRALRIFVGVIWIIQFECIPHGVSRTHPDAASRLQKTIESLGLPESSFAAELLSYAVKTLIDPEGKWPSDSQRPSAMDAAYDALIRLNRYIQAQR
jgi:hypothetical protein